MNNLNITPEDFTRINNDTNGNLHYVCHFLNLLSDKEQEEIRANAKPFQSVSNMYNEAIFKAKKVGGEKYHTKSYGGGIVFQSYNIQNLCNSLNSL